MRTNYVIAIICSLFIMVGSLPAQTSSSKTEKKDNIFSVFKKKETTETAQKEEVKSNKKRPLEDLDEDELKDSHKDARKKVRATKKERKAAEAREDAARARAEAIRAQKRVVKADKKVDKKEDKAKKARAKANDNKEKQR